MRRISIVGDGRTSFTLQFNIPTNTTLGAHTITATDAAAGISLKSPITLKANWPMYGFGPSGNRTNPYETAISAANVAQLQLAWKMDTPTGGGNVVYNAPTIADGRLYIGGGSSGPLKAYTADTGAFLWQTNLEVWPQPAYGYGRLLVGANILASIDPATGAGAVVFGGPVECWRSAHYRRRLRVRAGGRQAVELSAYGMPERAVFGGLGRTAHHSMISSARPPSPMVMSILARRTAMSMSLMLPPARCNGVV